LNCREFLDDTENLIISPSSSEDEDLDQTVQTDKCTVRDKIIRSLKKKKELESQKKKKEHDPSVKKIFEDAE